MLIDTTVLTAIADYSFDLKDLQLPFIKVLQIVLDNCLENRDDCNDPNNPDLLVIINHEIAALQSLIAQLT